MYSTKGLFIYNPLCSENMYSTKGLFIYNQNNKIVQYERFVYL